MKPKIGDILVYVFILTIVSLSFLGLRIMARDFDKLSAIIEVDGDIVKSIDISKEGLGAAARDIRVDTGNGGYNTIRILEGEIQIIDANCPDKLCVNSPPIRVPGQSIVCIPHRLIVSIRGSGKEDAVDDTAF